MTSLVWVEIFIYVEKYLIFLKQQQLHVVFFCSIWLVNIKVINTALYIKEMKINRQASMLTQKTCLTDKLILRMRKMRKENMYAYQYFIMVLVPCLQWLVARWLCIRHQQLVQAGSQIVRSLMPSVLRAKMQVSSLAEKR